MITIPESWKDCEVRITFWDHTEGSDSPELAVARGRLVTIRSDSVLIYSWEFPNDPNCSDITRFCILTSPIQSISRLIVQETLVDGG